MMKKLCLIGHPVNHSLSPIIYRYLCPKFNESCTYDLKDIEKDAFEQDLAMILENYDGFNITIPYKRRVARQFPQSGNVAVNCMIKESGQWRARNTDIDGFLLALKYHGIDIEDKKVAILGAGGAAIAAILAARKMNANITLFNRTIEKGVSLLEDLQVEADVYPLSAYQGGFDLTVQCTSVGLVDKNKSPLVGSFSGIGYDMIYGGQQKFMTQFETSFDGSSMLVGQGLYNFHHWFNVPLEKVIVYFDEVLNEIRK